MDEQARIDRIRQIGWQQGVVLPPTVAEAARTCGDRRWPEHVPVNTAADWLIVVSHPCDVRNRMPGKEPTAEVLVARTYTAKKLHSNFTHGKNSRRLDFIGLDDGTPVMLTSAAHERFVINRLVLAEGPPDPRRTLDRETIHILTEWIAKRYIRQAFPDAFDQAADAIKAKGKVDDFLVRHRKDGSVLEVFLAFPTQTDPPFRLDFLLVVAPNKIEPDWAAQQRRLEETFEACWEGAVSIDVEATAQRADHVSLDELMRGRFKKFDRDWISYEHDPESGSEPVG